MPPTSNTVHAEREGRVMTARLDNPPRNFMTGGMVAELDELVRLVEEDATIGAVVITGAPEDVFITHFDVREILRGSSVASGVSPRAAAGGLMAVGALRRIPGAHSALTRSPAAGVAGLQAIHELFDRMARIDVVFIAAVNGLALGGGCELALACDVRIMADRGLPIGLPEATLGLIPGAGGTQRVARMLGPSRALELMLEGRPLLPEAARDAGLVHHVVAPEDLMDEALATAHRLARRSPTAVGELKRAVYDAASRPMAEGLAAERAGFLSAAASPTGQRAMTAYVADLVELEERGTGDPTELLAILEEWREGTVVDQTDEG